MEIETKNSASDFNITRMVSLNEIINRLSIFAPSAFYRESSTQNEPIFLDALVPVSCVAAALRGTDLMPALGTAFDDKYAQKILRRYLEIEIKRSWAAGQIKNWQVGLLKRRRSSVMFWRNFSPDRKNSDPMKLWSETQKLLTACVIATEKVLEILKSEKSEDLSVTEAFKSMADNNHAPRFIEIALNEGEALHLLSDILLPIIEIDAKQASPLVSSAKGRFPRIKDSRFHDGALAAIMKIVEQKDDFHNCTADELKKHIKEKLSEMSEAGDGKFYLGIKNREYQFKIKNEPESLSSKQLNIRIESVLHVLSKSMSPAPVFSAGVTPRHKKKSP